MYFLHKIRGDQAALPPAPKASNLALAWLGAFMAIAALALLGQNLSVTLMLGSFGASCVLVFGYPDVPFSLPRNVVAGHVMSSLVGLACVHFFGNHWWSLAFAVACAVVLMMWLRVVHPPAGSNPVIVFLTQPAWDFWLYPTLAGALILVLCALVYHNVTRAAKYPKYW